MKLKEARIRAFLSMAKLAEKAGLSIATIRDIEAERHRPSLTTCGKLSTALEMKPEELDECRDTMERSLGQASSEQE